MKRPIRMTLRECDVGDVVRHDKQCAVVYPFHANGRRWVRFVDELTFAEIAEPTFLPDDLEVEVIARGVARYTKQGGATYDPVGEGN